MKFAAFLIVILGFIQITYAKNLGEIQVSRPVYGKMSTDSVLLYQPSKTLKCGYYLSKGKLYRSWGASLSFFVEDAEGNRSIIYHMGHSSMDGGSTQTLSVATADDYTLDTKRNIYQTIYTTGTATFIKTMMAPVPVTTLLLDRSLKKNEKFKSERDLEIKRISFQQQYRSVMGTQPPPFSDLKCDFNTSLKSF